MQGPSPSPPGQALGEYKNSSHPHDNDDDKGEAIKEAFVALAGQVRVAPHLRRGFARYELSRCRGTDALLYEGEDVVAGRNPGVYR